MARKRLLMLSAAALSSWLLAAYGLDAGRDAFEQASPTRGARATRSSTETVTPQHEPGASAPRDYRPISTLIDHGIIASALDTRTSIGAQPPGSHVRTGADPIASSAEERPPPDDPTTNREPDPQKRSALETAYSEEPHDDSHSTDMRSYLEERARAVDLDPRVVQETDCGTNVCRVVLAFAREKDAFTFAASAQSSNLRYEFRAPTAPVELGPEQRATLQAPDDAQTGNATRAPGLPLLAAFQQLAPRASPPIATPSPSVHTDSGPTKVEILLAPRDFAAPNEERPAASASNR